MITYNDYTNALIINKSPISETDFPAYAAEAERLILSAVTQPIPDKYAVCVSATACRLCHQLHIDNTAVAPVVEEITTPDGSKHVNSNTGARLKSQSESSGDYSYSFSYADMPTEQSKQAKYIKIIKDGLTHCNGEFTGLFYAGIVCR